MVGTVFTSTTTIIISVANYTYCTYMRGQCLKVVLVLNSYHCFEVEVVKENPHFLHGKADNTWCDHLEVDRWLKAGSSDGQHVTFLPSETSE